MYNFSSLRERAKRERTGNVYKIKKKRQRYERDSVRYEKKNHKTYFTVLNMDV
tara:strand:+ start:321 stop:479 length:159 start_codon:yes stop_codon:yes gene_type:complete